MTEGDITQDNFRRNFVLVLTMACGLAFLAMMVGFLDALFLAAVFSGIVHPLYRWLLSKFGGRRSPASLLTLVVSVLVILIPFILLLGLVAEQAAVVATMATPWIEAQYLELTTGEVKFPNWLPFANELEPYSDTILAKLAEFSAKVGGMLAEGLALFSQGTFTLFFELFIMVYAMYFFLIHGSRMIERIMDYIPLSRSDQQKIIEVGSSVSRATVKGTMIIGLAQGSLAGLGFAVAGIDAPIFWGAVMSILSVLPVVGTAVVWIPGVIYLMATGQTLAGVGLLVWCGAVVGSIDNILRPLLVGRDTEMPDLLILLSTVGGLKLFGTAGLILGPMLAALFMTILSIYRRVFADDLDVDEVSTEQLGD